MERENRDALGLPYAPLVFDTKLSVPSVDEFPPLGARHLEMVHLLIASNWTQRSRLGFARQALGVFRIESLLRGLARHSKRGANSAPTHACSMGSSRGLELQVFGEACQGLERHHGTKRIT